MGFAPEFAFFGNSLLWALFTLAWAASLLYLVEHKLAGWATFTVAVTIVFLQTCTDLQPLTLAYQHPTSALGYAALFLVAGIAVGIYKFWRFAVNINYDYEEFIDTMLLQYGFTWSSLDKGEQDRYIDLAVRHVTKGEFSYPLRLYQHKARITTWMAFWPIVGFWTLLKDPIRSFYIYAYQQIGSTLQAIADRAMAKVNPEYIRK